MQPGLQLCAKGAGNIPAVNDRKRKQNIIMLSLFGVKASVAML